MFVQKALVENGLLKCIKLYRLPLALWATQMAMPVTAPLMTATRTAGVNMATMASGARKQATRRHSASRLRYTWTQNTGF